MKKIATTAVMVALLIGSATGCTAQTPEPEQTQLGRISTIDELKDAFIDAGGVCNWKQTDVVTDATASGECSDQTVLMLFADMDEKEELVSFLSEGSISEPTILVGENWVINSPEAEDMQGALGGEWVD
ncbi:hypothetical protein Q9S78_11980 [Microbacterium sp. KSW-18]|uniref:Lipoprotein n=1 Tax=Microbacterium aquilitoris TaxID=3067307 RepID=A0ABU3GL07_9MICO|nr:hypothetical protein [Microbacterium sp. KSW-18]MDT3331387.1 hypothetical protein [Microbacterium sp. KSW-18]